MENLDRIVHEPARLMIMALLSGAKEADFIFLLHETGLTKGNLSSHLEKLQDAAYITVEKKFRGKIPVTVLRMTPKGRAALQTYRTQLESIFRRRVSGDDPLS